MASSSSTSPTLTAVPASGAAVSARRANTIVAATGATIGVLATLLGPFLSFRPNRVIDGVQASALDAFGVDGVDRHRPVAGRAPRSPSSSRVASWARCAACSAPRSSRSSCSRAVSAATEFAATQGTVARTSFSVSFYYVLIAFFLVEYAAMRDTSGALGQGRHHPRRHRRGRCRRCASARSRSWVSCASGS